MKPLALALILAAATVPALAKAATRVSSTTNCPSADAVSQRLLGLLAAGGPASASARVRSEGEALHIELSIPGEANQERTVPVNGDCDARAEMAALVIAAWLDVMPVGTISTPGVPPGVLPPAPATAAAPPAPLVDVSPVPPVLDTHTLIGAGLLGLADSQGVTGGFALMGGMPSLVKGFGWAAEASLTLPRSLNVGEGVARYWRPTFSLAATREQRFDKWRLLPQLGAVLAVLSIKGQSFAENARPTTVNWGVSAGVALARAAMGTWPWLRLEGVIWPQGRSLRSQATDGSSDIVVALSTWEVRLSAGASWEIF